MNTNIFEKLSASLSAPGAEKMTAGIIAEYFESEGYCVKTDNMGNVIAETGTDGEKTAVFVPMDIPGLVVTYIEDSGLVRTAPLGTYDFRSACYAPVTDGRITGVFEPEEGGTSFEKSHVDFGFADRAEAEKEIMPGDVLFYAKNAVKLKNGMTAGTGTAVSACIASVCRAARQTEKNSGKRICFVFCAQSFLNQRGAGPAAFGANPQKALCISPYDGKSIAVKILDKSLVCDRELSDVLFDCALKYDEKAVRLVKADEMSDAGKVSQAFCGIRTASLMLPAKNLGTSAEIVKESDIDALSKITVQFLNNI